MLHDALVHADAPAERRLMLVLVVIAKYRNIVCLGEACSVCACTALPLQV